MSDFPPYMQGGKETDKDSKVHIVERLRCYDCDEPLSEMHYGCCGYDACGWQNTKTHKCKRRGKGWVR